MNAVNPQVKSIFGQALAIDGTEERAAYLEQACGADAALRAEVKNLLTALEKAGDFLRQPAGVSEAEATPPSGAEAGAVIAGRFRREGMGDGLHRGKKHGAGIDLPRCGG
jgi:hypothetical protein